MTALKNRIQIVGRDGKMANPFWNENSSNIGGSNTCKNTLNMGLRMGKLAQMVKKFSNQRIKRMIEYDPENPDVTYRPDFLMPPENFPCEENPASNFSCEEMTWISEVLNGYAESEIKSCGPPLLGGGFGASTRPSEVDPFIYTGLKNANNKAPCV